MVGNGPLNSENITGLREDLDNALDEAGGRAELYLAGGARMLFGWRTDRHTSDLDGVMRTGQTVLMTTAMRISERHGLEPTWVNPAVTYFVPTKPDLGETTVYGGKALTVKGAENITGLTRGPCIYPQSSEAGGRAELYSIEHMLAMKIRSHRDIDLDDAEVLIRRLKLTSTGRCPADRRGRIRRPPCRRYQQEDDPRRSGPARRDDARTHHQPHRRETSGQTSEEIPATQSRRNRPRVWNKTRGCTATISQTRRCGKGDNENSRAWGLLSRLAACGKSR